MKDKEKILKDLLMVAEYFGKELTQSMQILYIKALSRFDDAELDAALKSCVQRLKFFPKISEIIEMIDDGDNSEAVWLQVLDAVKSTGGRKLHIFEDAAINTAIQSIGGWHNLCRTFESDLHWRKRDFLQTYNAIKPAIARNQITSRDEAKAIIGQIKKSER